MTTAERAVADALLDDVAALTPQIRAAADEAEKRRRLPDDLVQAMQAAGFYRMWVPSALGGSEVDPLTVMRVVEALARADGSTGWCVFAQAANGLVLAPRLEQPAGAEVFADPDTVLVEANQPRGRAVPVVDGYRITGRWPFGSGASHAQWFAGTCVILDGDQPRLLPNGKPDARLCVFPATDCTVIDTWTTTGLRATASHDWAVTDVVVPDRFVAHAAADRDAYPDPLYRAGVFLLGGCAAIALGIARHALDAFRELATEKTPFTFTQRLCEQQRVQAEVARAEALVGAARSYLYESCGTLWDTLSRGETVTQSGKAPVALAAQLALTHALEATEITYRLGGGTSVYTASPLDRCLRDLHTLAGHFGFGPTQSEAAGRACLGMEPAMAFW